MAYDPDYPPAGRVLIRSAEMRAQFHGLKDLIDAVPAGPPGPTGPEGPTGPPGVPGEVSYAQLVSAMGEVVAGSSANSNTVPTLNTPFTNDPPTPADLEVLRTAFNTLVLALRR